MRGKMARSELEEAKAWTIMRSELEIQMRGKVVRSELEEAKAWTIMWSELEVQMRGKVVRSELEVQMRGKNDAVWGGRCEGADNNAGNGESNVF